MTELDIDLLLNKYDKIMYLKIYVNGCNNLKNMYISAINKHNHKLCNNVFMDAGFDLFLPENDDSKELDIWGETIRFFGIGWKNSSPVNKVDFKINCSAQMLCDNEKVFSTGYYIYPRSSLSKTKLRLANSVGIIDAGYRGTLIGMFDVVNIDNNSYQFSSDKAADYYAKSYDRLVQICAPGLVPIFVEMVDSIEALGIETERGSGGFGSTGK